MVIAVVIGIVLITVGGLFMALEGIRRNHLSWVAASALTGGMVGLVGALGMFAIVGTLVPDALRKDAAEAALREDIALVMDAGVNVLLGSAAAATLVLLAAVVAAVAVLKARQIQKSSKS